MPEQVPSDLPKQLRLLEVLAEEPSVRQADLAARVRVAVGTVNWLLKHMAKKGYVKARRIGQWRWRYLLTPQGLAEKTRLLEEYLHDSLSLYRRIRQGAHWRRIPDFVSIDERQPHSGAIQPSTEDDTCTQVSCGSILLHKDTVDGCS